MILSRRGFLSMFQGLCLVPLVSSISVPAPDCPPLMLNRFFVAGFQYHDGARVLPYLKPGQDLDLVAEPSNPHDRFAVAVLWQGSKLGYVPRTDNKHLSRLLAQKAELFCRVIGTTPDENPWRAVKVEVGLG